jgi:protein arginine kinase activator
MVALKFRARAAGTLTGTNYFAWQARMTEENPLSMHFSPTYERPLECTECKKKIAVHYTEIVNQTITRTCMCEDCPALHRRLRGISSNVERKADEVIADLVCGQCGTTLEMVRTGHPLGCGSCYEVFGDVVLSELVSAHKLPSMRTAYSGRPLHVGRVPGESQQINPSLRLLALNEALSDTLLREDYEQAAWLRDQIKALTENNSQEASEEAKPSHENE